MRLMKREKMMVAGGVLLFGLFLAAQFVVRPTLERIATLQRVASSKRDVLAQLRTKCREYAQLEAEVARLRSIIKQQDESGRILSTIDHIRDACGLSENVLSLKPTTMAINEKYQATIIEVRLEGITLAQLLQFLSQLDSLELAGGIKSLEVRHADRSPGALRAVFQVAALSQVQPL